jgi:hypothetical protein
MQDSVKQIPEAAKDSRFLINFTDNFKSAVKKLEVGSGTFSLEDWMGHVRKLNGFKLTGGKGKSNLKGEDRDFV